MICSVSSGSQAKPGQITVLSVEGRAQKLVASDGKNTWQPIKAGEKLSEQTVIRTGFRSSVVLRFADRGEVTVRNATKMGIGEFRKSGDSVRTRLGLKYGAVRASVDSSRGPNDWQVRTPVATLSVRGTSGDVAYSGDGGARCKGSAGRWSMKTGSRSRIIRPTEMSSTLVSGGGGLTRSINIFKQARDMQMGDTFGGLSRPEKKTLVNHGTGPSVLGAVKRKARRRFGNRPARLGSSSSQHAIGGSGDSE